MKYFSEHKDWIYHTTSSAMTFLAGAFVVLATDLVAYGGTVSSLRLEDMTLASAIGALNVVFRLFIIAVVKTAYKKFQEKYR